jgi:hypothetical protein
LGPREKEAIVTRIGCTGHQTLSPATRREVAAEIAAALARHGDDDLVGLSSLAEGADQLFAFAVWAAGGRFHAVIPCRNYGQSFRSAAARTTYENFLDFAAGSDTLDFEGPSEAAFLAAGHEVADHCDLLVAVWDGAVAAGTGGTADVVDYAKSRDIETLIIWPPGARRE